MNDDPQASDSTQARSRAAHAAHEALRRLADSMRDASIERLLHDEPARGERLVVEAAGLHADFTRHRLPLPALDALLALARTLEVEQRRDAMFAGEPVNFTERRPALHVALRRPAPAAGDADPIAADVAQTLARMSAFGDAVRDGRWTGATGRRIDAVVHVGIGGSHLGPQLACEALAHDADARLECRFLSNVDPDALRRATEGLDPATTLAIVASKSWHTTETARNAAAMRRWYAHGGIAGDALRRHFVAVTSNVDAALAFGLAGESIFPMRDWVGGRYSMWSAIGLPILLKIGSRAFREMLDGAHAMDRHFREAPPARNMPLLMALVSLWNRLALDGGSEVVVPYSDALRSLVAYLQQLQMESNGKRIGRDGRPVAWETAPPVWGSTGTDAQHSFFQALHQGTNVHPVDFIVVVPERDDEERRGIALLANALAQVEALARGRRAGDDALAAHRGTPGNRPSTVLLLDRLDARRFGALIALYEHKTATLGWLWDIDSFDQWGVELGKVLAAEIEPLLAPSGDVPASRSPPTVEPLIRWIRKRLDDRDARPGAPRGA